MREELDALLLLCTSKLDTLWPAPASGDATQGAGGTRADGLAPGALVADRYRLKRVLGAGAYGRVWRATDTTTETDVAFKEMRAPPDGGDTSGAQASEFSTLSRLKHPNIVKVIDYGSLDEDARFVVMELVPGDDVASRLKNGPMPAAAVWRVLEDLAAAVELLHTRRFVHCDIKADNVRVTEAGVAKLMDFGLLLPLGQPASTLQGTPQYMAPEMFLGGVIDGRTDLYAVGVLAYEMFTGAIPFDGADLRELAEKHLRTTPRPPSYFLDLPAGTDEIVLRLLAKEPNQRFDDAGQLLDAIARVTGRARSAAGAAKQTSFLYAAHLIGRDGERARAEEARAALAGKRGASLLFAGGRGAGKTRFVDEIALRAKLDRQCVARATCRAVGQALLEPMAAALDAVLPFTDDDTIAELGPALAHLSPAIRARGIAPAAVPDPMEAKVRLYAAVTGWLSRSAAKVPIVVIVDDIHLADGASIDLYNHLVRSLAQASVLFVATFGSDDSDGLGPVLATVHEGRTSRVELPPLPRDDLRRLIDDTLHAHALDDGFIDALFAITAGNPFFSIEALRFLIEDGQVTRHAGRFVSTTPGLKVPVSIAETVAARLGTFPSALRDAARICAAQGLEVDLDVAARQLELDRAALDLHLEELLERQVWRRVGRRILFSQEVAREAIYATLSPEERRTAHDRVAAVLGDGSRNGKAPSPALLAHHLKRGHEPRRAVPHFIAGARTAAAAQQPIEATKLLTEASALLDDEARNRDEAVALYDLLATISARAHPPSCVLAVDKLIAIFAREFELDDAAERVKKRTRLAARLPSIFAHRMRPDAPGRPFESGTRNPTRILLRLLEHQAQQAINLATMGMIDRATAAVADVKRRVPDPASPLVRFTVIAELLALGHTGRSAEAIRVARALQASFGSGPPHPSLAFPYFWSFYGCAMAEVLSGRPLSQDVGERLDEIASRSGRVQDRAFALLPRFVEACHRGLHERSVAIAREMEDICFRLAYPQPISSRLRLWHPVFLIERGELERAEASTRGIAVFAAATKDGWLETYAAIYRGQIALARGDAATAVTELRKAVEAARTRKLGRLTQALLSLAEALREVGDLEGARATAEEALARATSEEFGGPYDEIVSSRVLGDILGPGRGEILIDRARTQAHAIENPIQLAFAELAHGRMTARPESLARADEIFAKLENSRGRELVLRAKQRGTA